MRHALTFAGLLALAGMVAGCGIEEPSPRRVAQQRQPTPPGLFGMPTGDGNPSPPTLPLVATSERLLFSEWTLEQTAVAALGRIGAPAVAHLVELIGDPDPRLREDAARALARMGTDAHEAVPELTKLLNDRSPDVRKDAMRALAEIGPASGPAVPEIIQQLRVSAAEEEKREAEAKKQAQAHAQPATGKAGPSAGSGS